MEQESKAIKSGDTVVRKNEPIPSVYYGTVYGFTVEGKVKVNWKNGKRSKLKPEYLKIIQPSLS